MEPVRVERVTVYYACAWCRREFLSPKSARRCMGSHERVTDREMSERLSEFIAYRVERGDGHACVAKRVGLSRRTVVTRLGNRERFLKKECVPVWLAALRHPLLRALLNDLAEGA
jgi:hypothetical protein